MLGIIAALDYEIQLISERLENTEESEICGCRFWRGTIGGLKAVAARCGAGKVSGAVCATVMIMRFGVSAIINTGIAGGLAPGMRRGDVALADAFVQHDMDTTGVGDPLGYISSLKTVFMSTDKTMTDRIFTAINSGDLSVFRGVIATGDQFIADRAVSRGIAEKFGAIAVEMEGGAIAQVCAQAGVPFAALRCISDNADDDAVFDFPAFAKTAADRCARLVIELAEEGGI